MEVATVFDDATEERTPGTRLLPPTHETHDIVVVAPPEPSRQPRSSAVVRVLPIVTAVATVAAIAAAYYARAAVARSPALMMFPLMMLVSAIATVISGADRRRGDLDAHRADYLDYLAELRATVLETAAAQHDSLLWRYPDPDALWMLVGGPRMWQQADVCQLRIGVGRRPLATRLIPPTVSAARRIDPVGADALRRFLASYSTVPGVPIVIALQGQPAVRVRGEPVQVRAALRAMLCQLAVMHSPAAVMFAAVVDVSRLPDWEWLKWLPHNRHPSLRDDIGAARMVYVSLAAARETLSQPAVGATAPHVVMVVDTAEQPDGFVAEGTTVLTLDPGDGAPVVVAASGEEVDAHVDQLSDSAALLCAQRLAGYRPSRRAAAIGGTSWQDLVGIDDVDSFSPVAYRDSGNAPAFLRVPVGTTDAGDTVELDIKESAAGGIGPHGLCLGATGSGKSEFLRTVALGLIARHSSDDLNLVLVDFKGGATFAGLEPAPHVAAVITNLADKAALVARMRDALMGELNRRQEVLREAGNLDGIAAYRRRRRTDPRLAALPALFIVVDEFSELLSQQADFADVFVAIGRLGRSLGIHLLLASQRLDEGRLRGLESHLSYRVCLKTLSINESRVVLGTSEAYELPGNPGAAYLRVGTDVPLRFQTAFVSGPAATSRASIPLDSARVHPFTAAPVGRLVSGHGADHAETPTVLQTIVERLSGDRPSAHAIWLPPLGASPALNTVLCEAARAAPLTVPIGMVDCPFDQQRAHLIVDMSGAAGNVAVVGAPQSGKSTTLRTLITALAVTHDPRLVQFYCLDFGGGSLSTMRQWPHVGAVAGRGDPERVRRTIARLVAVVRSRETLFCDNDIESMDHYRRLKSARDPRCDRYGDIVLVVDGWPALQRELDTAEHAITTLAAEGLSYGVHVVIAASRWPDIRPALRDQIGTRIELRLGDPADSEFDRRRAQQVPEGRPGRGLSDDGQQMVVALPRLDSVESAAGLAEAAASVGEMLRRRHDWTAPPVPVLPARIDHARIAEHVDAQNVGVVIGVEETELRPVTIDFAQQSHLLVFGDGDSGKTSTLRTVCAELLRPSTVAQRHVVFVDPRRSLLGMIEQHDYLASADAVAEAMPALSELLRRRMPPIDATPSQLRDRSWWSGPEIYVVIDDYDLLGGGGTGLFAPLLEFLPHSRDVGLHVVVARRTGGAARALFEPLLAGLRDAGCATLLLSGRPDDGLTIGSVRPTPLPPGRAVLVPRRGDPAMIHVGWTPPP